MPSANSQQQHQNDAFINTHNHLSGSESYKKDPGILLISDNNGLVVSRSGQVLDERSSSLKLFKGGSPLALELAYPYLLTILPKCIEVRNPISTALLQNIHISGPKVIYNSNRLVYIADALTVYKLVPENYGTVIDSIAEKGYLEEAINLLGVIPNVWISDKDERLRNLNILKAKDLFQKGNYEDSMFLFIDISANPDDVIPLCASLIDEGQDRTNASNGLEVNISEEDLVANSHSINSGGAASSTPSILSSQRLLVADDNNRDALRALLSYLVDARRKISKLSSADPDSNLIFNGIKLVPEFYGSNLSQAATKIDTTLLKCYMQINPGLVGPLLRV
ncbi:hypothetical protein NADFUDRAFT_84320, partial [Nadsonia fulvescens var. elongata DSM 6958]